MFFILPFLLSKNPMLYKTNSSSNTLSLCLLSISSSWFHIHSFPFLISNKMMLSYQMLSPFSMIKFLLLSFMDLQYVSFVLLSYHSLQLNSLMKAFNLSFLHSKMTFYTLMTLLHMQAQSYALNHLKCYFFWFSL
jgi:hypothetical protein